MVTSVASSWRRALITSWSNASASTGASGTAPGVCSPIVTPWALTVESSAVRLSRTSRGGAPVQVGDPGHQRNAACQRTEAELLCAPAGLSTLAHRGHQLGQQPSDVGVLLVASDRE